MSHIIRLSKNLYQRLEKYAVGFDSPVQAIERILNKIEGIQAEPEKKSYSKDGTLSIKLNPQDPDTFKEELLEKRRAKIIEYYDDGREPVCIEWNASRFSEDSNVIGNLRSRPDYRQGAWQAKGLKYIYVSV